MAIEIKAPAFPESVADGEIAAWHKKEGDHVSRDDLIVEIETDKVVMEVVAPEDGVIQKIHVAEGDTILSEALLATLIPGAGAATSNASAAASEAESADVDPQDAGAAEAMLGPAARQLVEEHGLDVSRISGTGKGGRITKEDIVKFMKSVSAAATTAANTSTAAAATASDTPVGLSSERVEKRVPMTRMRARIAERSK